MEVRQRYRVSMFDVDVVFIYFASYYQWMDRGFQLLLGECELPLGQMIQEGYSFPAVQSGCTYFEPARLDDDIEVVTRVCAVGRSSVDVRHKFLNANTGTQVAEGRVVHVYTNLRKRKSESVPEWLVERIYPNNDRS